MQPRLEIIFAPDSTWDSGETSLTDRPPIVRCVAAFGYDDIECLVNWVDVPHAPNGPNEDGASFRLAGGDGGGELRP
jgi:hypothetical protein